VRPRSLWPREHGAYAQLAAPLAMALAAHTPSVAAGLLAIAASAAFLANEPLLVVLGHRGRRMQQADGHRALRRAALLGAVAIIAGVAGYVLGNESVRIACAIAGAFGTAVIWLARTRRQHSFIGELLACIALPAAAVPAATASGDTLCAALVVSAAWSAGFGCSVVAVRRVIARRRRSATRVDRIIALALALAWLGILALAPHDAALVAAPLVLGSLLVAIWAPPATRLRAIGIGFACAAAAAACLGVANPAFDAQWHRPRAAFAR